MPMVQSAGINSTLYMYVQNDDMILPLQDQFANAFLHDSNVTFPVTLHRAVSSMGTNIHTLNMLQGHFYIPVVYSRNTFGTQ